MVCNLPVGPSLKLSQHHKMLPKLQHSLQYRQIGIFSKVVSVVETARPARLHVGYPLMLDGPGVGCPAVAVHIQGICVLYHNTRFSECIHTAQDEVQLAARFEHHPHCSM